MSESIRQGDAMEHATKSPSDPQRGRPAVKRTVDPSTAGTVADNPKVITQRELLKGIAHSPRMVAQQMRLRNVFGPAIRRQARRETGALQKGPLRQAVFEPIQRLGPPEEDAANASRRLVQRKALNTNLLNVVGEKHTEAEEREDREREIAQGLGLPYWLEYEFLAEHADHEQADTWMTKRVADPIMLRVARRFHVVRHTISGYSQALAFYRQNLASNLVNPKVDQWLKRLESVTLPADFESLGQILNLAENEEVKAAGTRETYEQIVELFGALHNSMGNLINTRESDDELEVAGQVESIRILVTKQTDVTSIADADKKRSMKMFEVARSRHAERGVWKIGQNHIDDMREPDTRNGQAINFDMQSEQEFSDTYFPKDEGKTS